MSDYTRVLKGLRHCINLDGLEPNDTRIRCHGCPYFTEPTRCGGILMRDAAAAIEDLQRELSLAEIAADDNGRQVEALQAEVKRLEPKRGEWVGVSPMVDTVQCSVCGGQLFSAELETPYCPYCGAKMTEVQE